MTTLSRRVVLSGLLAVSAVPVGVMGVQEALAQERDPFAERLNMDAVKAIAASYMAVSGDTVDAEAQAKLFPGGAADAAALKAGAVADFTEDRIFQHEGWRLSYTEGQLFTLLSRAA